MPVTNDNPVPYTTVSSIIGIIYRYRNRGLPAPFTREVLARAGVSDSLSHRTIQALQTLDLIDESYNPTATLEGLRLASETEYQQRLQDWIKGAYADVFNFVDPSTDDETAIRDAFRHYEPVGQQNRMVTLFIGLCEAAGIRDESQRETKLRTRATTPRQPSQIRSKRTGSKKPSQSITSNIPSALTGLLGSLPSEGQEWTKTRRDDFVKTFEAVLDFCYPTQNNAPSESNDNSTNQEKGE